MSYVETKFETRGRCAFCGEEKWVERRTYLVNADESDPLFASLEADFLAEQAKDKVFVVDCSCSQSEQLEGGYEIRTHIVKKFDRCIDVYQNDNQLEETRLILKKNGRDSYRISQTVPWPTQKIGPVYRTYHEAVVAYEAAIETLKADLRAKIARWAEADAQDVE